MRSRVTVGFIIACIGIFASASAWAFEGRYTRQQNFVLIKRQANGAFSVTADVTRPGCIAEIEAPARMEGDKLVATEGTGADACRLVITQTGDGVSVQERGGCQFHRGAACSYEGSFRRAGAPPARAK